jgi:hypothetical protein
MGAKKPKTEYLLVMGEDLEFQMCDSMRQVSDVLEQEEFNTVESFDFLNFKKANAACSEEHSKNGVVLVVQDGKVRPVILDVRSVTEFTRDFDSEK